MTHTFHYLKRIPSKRFRAAVLLPFLSVSLWAQQVSGRVQDTEGEPVAYAYVVLLQKADSVVLTGTTTDEAGTFKLIVSDRQKCCLQVSHIGYRTQKVAIDGASVVVTLQPEAIDEIVVTGERIMRDASSQTYFITDSLRKASANAMQLLGKLQGISIDWATEGVKIGEYRDVPVMVEGREVGAQYVRGLNPARIRRVEMLRYPKEKYGDAPIVLNIILNNAYTGFDLGMHARAMASYKNKHSHQADGGATFTYATKKWDLYGDAALKEKRTYKATAYAQTYQEASETTAREDCRHPNGNDRLVDLNVSAGVDFKVKPGHTLSLQSWVERGGGKEDEAYNDAADVFLSRTKEDYQATSVTAGAYYKGEVAGKLQLSGDVTYNYYDVDEDKRYTLLEEVSRQLYEGKKNYWRANADARYTWSDKVGGTIGYTFTDKDYTNYNKPDGARLFSTRERRHDAYFSVSVAPGDNFNFVVGSNFLYVHEKNDTLREGNFSWMPLAKLYWRPLKVLSLLGNYFCDVQHPNLDQLSTVAYRRNDYLWHKGNPTLRANVMHYMELRLDVKDIVEFTYMYKHTAHEISPWYYTEEDRVIETLTGGDYVHQYAGFSGDYALPHRIGINFTANYQWYKRRAAGESAWQRGHTWYVDVTAGWQATGHLALMAGYFLRYDRQPLLQGMQYKQDEQCMVGANISLLQNKLSLMVATTIPTNALPKRAYSEVTLPDYHYITWNNEKVNNALFQVSLRWNIGKGKADRPQHVNHTETEKPQK